MPDVGDRATAMLLVTPFDDTTSATLQVTGPDGVVTSPVATTEDGGNTWSAPIEYTLAGVWTYKWTVTGEGASVEYEEVGVGPGPLYVDPDVRVYATTTDLANYLKEAPPAFARKSLENASRALDSALLTAVYPVDVDGYPTNARHIRAFARATCAIVEWWGETGDELGAGGDWASASAGGVSISRGAGANGKTQSTQVSSGQLPARAWNELRTEGILPGVVYQR